MTLSDSYTIKAIHRRVGRYLKRQEKRLQGLFWEALDRICAGPFPSDDPAYITP